MGGVPCSRYVSWLPIESSNSNGWSNVQVPHAHVNFQQHMQNPPTGGSSDVLHVQYWWGGSWVLKGHPARLVGTLVVKASGLIGINCRGLHSFFLEGPEGNRSGPLTGARGWCSAPVACQATSTAMSSLHR